MSRIGVADLIGRVFYVDPAREEPGSLLALVSFRQGSGLHDRCSIRRSARLVAAQRARVPFGNNWQKNGSGCHLHQRRGRESQLLRQGLIANNWTSIRREP